MRARMAIIRVVLFLMASQLSAAADRYPKLEELYAGKQFFDLRDALQAYGKDQSTELVFYRAVVAATFNQPELAISYIQKYLKQVDGSRDSRQVDCYAMLADSYLKTYQYRKASEAYGAVLTKFRDEVDAKDARDFENSLKLWAALREVPPQTVRFEGDSTIQSSKNEVGVHVLGEVNRQQIPLLLDTGANLSVITRSFAAQLGFTLIEASIEVGAITGNTVIAQLGVAPAMKIGNVTIRNAVFLVLDDKDLYIAPAKFQINGIIGFPVISALREITLVRNGEIRILAKPGKHSERNMALDGLTLLIAGMFRDKRLTFALDTGANRSDLWPSFYRAYEGEIKGQYTPQTDRIGGAGGFKDVMAYRLKDLVMKFAGKDARLADVRVLTEPTLEKSRYFYGNLGRDLIDQFERMTLNFQAMSITFE
jgi:predicted aspartyl protease